MRPSRRLAGCLVLFFCLAAVPASQPVKYTLKPDAPECVKKWWADQPRIRSDAREVLKNSLRIAQVAVSDARAGRVTGTSGHTLYGNGHTQFSYSTGDEKQDAIAKAQGQLTRVKDGLAHVADAMLCEDVPVKVNQVSELVVLRVKQVAGPNSAIVEYDEQDVWLEGYDTSQLVDDNVYTPDAPVCIICTGTKTYDTANGSTRTIPLAHMFRASDYLVPKR